MEDLSWVLEEAGATAEELEWEHRMDISASVYARMKELGLNESDLAESIGVNKSQVSRLIRGQRNLTLSTIAAIEAALDFRLDGGFRYYADTALEMPAARPTCAEPSICKDSSHATQTRKQTMTR